MDDARKCENPDCGKSFVSNYAHKRYCSNLCMRTSTHVCADAKPVRKCHDCQNITADYRCKACLHKWRMRHGVPTHVHDVNALDSGF